MNDAPGVARRLAAFLYEGVLLFGVLMLVGLVYAGLTQQRHALQGRHGLQAFAFVALAGYFVWFWSHGGQTLAMKTWHLRVSGRDGGALSLARALARYLLAWLWFAPALLGLWLAQVHALAPIALGLAAGVAAYAALALLLPGRQFLHDVLCGTRVVDSRSRGSGHNRAP